MFIGFLSPPIKEPYATCILARFLKTKKLLVSQACLGANVLSGLVPSKVFRNIIGHSWGLVYGEGGAPGTVPLHSLRVTSHVLHQYAPLWWYQVRFF